MIWRCWFACIGPTRCWQHKLTSLPPQSMACSPPWSLMISSWKKRAWRHPPQRRDNRRHLRSHLPPIWGSSWTWRMLLCGGLGRKIKDDCKTTEKQFYGIEVRSPSVTRAVKCVCEPDHQDDRYADVLMSKPAPILTQLPLCYLLLVIPATVWPGLILWGQPRSWWRQHLTSSLISIYVFVFLYGGVKTYWSN